MSALECITYIVLGATVGGFVGTIGVGDGALKTPALIFLGMPVRIAVGTDLLYAGVTNRQAPSPTSGVKTSPGIRCSSWLQGVAHRHYSNC
tara:strand:+ start:1081 stop:1353 length:273 start_codon:yes stop_codon:yes gene_type:complete